MKPSPPARNRPTQGSLRRAAKRTAERLLVAARVPEVGRWWHRRGTVVLAYHNVLPDGAKACGDQSLHLPRERFARQLDRLSKTHVVVGIDDLLRAHTDSEKPRAIITFDDAYRGALEYGLPELTRRGMVGTVFVAPGLLGDRAFWWDLLASSASGEVPPPLRDRALTVHRGRQAEIEKALASDLRGVDLVPSHSRSATETELQAAVRGHDVFLGSHSWSHPNLTALEEGEVTDELERSWRWLVDRFSSVVPWLAYPYGLTCDPVVETARGIFEGALSLTGRLAPRGLDESARHRVPRINIPAGLSLQAFDLRVAGVVQR